MQDYSGLPHDLPAGQPASVNNFRSLAAKDCDVGEVLLALGDAAFVAGLVLLADEAVRRATSQRFAIDIGVSTTNFLLDVRPNLLRGSKGPVLKAGIGEVLRKLGAVLTCAAELGSPGPVARCLEGLGHTLLKVSNARSVESVECRTAPLLHLHQTLHGGNHNAIEPEVLRPGKDVICRPLGQHRIGGFGNSHEVDKARTFRTGNSRAAPLVFRSRLRVTGQTSHKNLRRGKKQIGHRGKRSSQCTPEQRSARAERSDAVGFDNRFQPLGRMFAGEHAQSVEDC